MGCADRSCYDLSRHTEMTKTELTAKVDLPEPVREGGRGRGREGEGERVRGRGRKRRRERTDRYNMIIIASLYCFLSYSERWIVLRWYLTNHQ